MDPEGGEAGRPVVTARYYAVNDRPVLFAPTPEGGLDALVVDWASGALVPDRSYFGRVSDVGIGKDVDQLTEDQFHAAVAAIRRPILARLTAMTITWSATGDGIEPYRHESDGHTYLIRVNDFPAEPLYTVLVDGQALGDLEDWPAAWIRPPAADAAPAPPNG